MSRRTKFLLSITGCLALAIALSLALRTPRNAQPRMQVEEGRVFDDLGTFACGDGRFALNIASMPSGATSISVVVDDGSSTYPVFETGAKNEEWFVSMDQYQRIWMFIGASSDKGGRQEPVVFMHGLEFRDGEIKTVISEVTRSGDWSGVPEEFLLRVRKASPQFMSQIPSVASTFPPEQHSRLLAQLGRQRTKR